MPLQMMSLWYWTRKLIVHRSVLGAVKSMDHVCGGVPVHWTRKKHPNVCSRALRRQAADTLKQDTPWAKEILEAMKEMEGSNGLFRWMWLCMMCSTWEKSFPAPPLRSRPRW